jgi:NADPH-dependent curcumin reductase CurA
MHYFLFTLSYNRLTYFFLLQKLKNYLTIVNNGMAAYFGIDICKLKKGETIVVSTAAGATGLLAS